MKRGEAKRIETSLLVQQEVFERSYLSILTGLKHTDQKFLSNLKIIQSQIDSVRRKEALNLQKSLLAIVMVIQKFKQNVKDEKYLEEHDVEHIKTHLMSIEENISSFKSLLNEQLEALHTNENELQQAIDSLTQRKHESPRTLDNPTTASIRLQAHPRVHTHISEELHPDIQEFQSFVQSRGGHSGGWDVNDHLLFTRLLQKYRGSSQMTVALLDLMPDKTAEEIAEHESWYHDYLTLKEAHRMAIQEWREEQRTAKQNHMFKEQENSVIVDQSEIRENKPELKRDPQLKEKIRKWKLVMEEKRKEELRQLKQKKKEEEDHWKKKVEYFAHQRKILALRKDHQGSAREAKAQSDNNEIHHLHEVQQQVKHARIPLRDFWEQDRQFVQRRMARLQQHYKSSSPLRSSSCSSSHSRIHIERDPARLLQSTAVWRAHIKRSLSEDNRKPSNARSMYIADIPHLAVPKWRDGVV